MPQGDDAVSIENAGAQLAEKGVDAFDQWTKVTWTYPGLIREIAVSAAKNGELGVASGGLFTVGHIPDSIRRLPGLGLRQKTQAIMWAEQFAADALMTIVDAAGEVPTLGLAAFISFEMIPDLLADEPWAKSRILRLCSVARALGKRGKLAQFSLNELGTIGRRAVREVRGDDTLAEAVTAIAETLEYVAGEAGRGGSIDGPAVVIEAATQLKSLQEWNDSNLAIAPRAWERVSRASERVQALAAQLSDQHTTLTWPSLRSPESE